MTWEDFLASGDALVPAVAIAGPAVAARIGQPIEELWAEQYRLFENSIELHRLPARYVARRLAEVLVDLYRDGSSPAPA